MKVKEAIEKLKSLPENAELVSEDYEYSTYDLIGDFNIVGSFKDTVYVLAKPAVVVCSTNKMNKDYLGTE